MKLWFAGFYQVCIVVYALNLQNCGLLSMAGNDKALEESTFSYKNCCNDQTGIVSR